MEKQDSISEKGKEIKNQLGRVYKAFLCEPYKGENYDLYRGERIALEFALKEIGVGADEIEDIERRIENEFEEEYGGSFSGREMAYKDMLEKVHEEREKREERLYYESKDYDKRKGEIWAYKQMEEWLKYQIENIEEHISKIEDRIWL